VYDRLCISLALITSMSVASVIAQQSATVTGRITDAQSKPRVNVTVSIAGKVGFTDIRGVYRIKGVAWGNQLPMQIKRSGKVLKATKIDVRSSIVTRHERVP
jgi:hypothetical protein